MNDLIDREALLKLVPTEEIVSAMAIKAAPKVDAVEVVRCKDCKWYEIGKSYEPYCNNAKNLFEEMNRDDYCSYGERRSE